MDGNDGRLIEVLERIADRLNSIAVELEETNAGIKQLGDAVSTVSQCIEEHRGC